MPSSGKKRAHGLPAELLPQEVVVVLRAVIMKSFMNTAYAEAALARRGQNPYNRAPLDHPQILSTAPKAVQQERTKILQSRGINTGVEMTAPPTQRDLLSTGSGRLAGGVAAAGAVQQSIEELDHTGQTAGDLLKLMQDAKNKTEGRRRNTDTNPVLTRDELNKRYAPHKRFTTGVVFGQGDAYLGPEVRDKVIAMNDARHEKEAAKANNKKKKMRKLADDVAGIRYKQEMEPSFTLLNHHLDTLIRWKRQKGDKPLESKRKEHLLQRWNETKGRRSPHVSPDDEEEGGDDDGDGDGDGEWCDDADSEVGGR